MEIALNFVTPSDESASMRKVALRLKGKPREDQESAHLCIVLDTSDSMNDGAKLGSCKKSIGFILDLMRDKDAVSLVTFGEDAKVVAKCVEMRAENKANFLAQVSGIHTDGCTNMSAGLISAKEVIEPADSTRKQGILLLTDGHANRGVYNPDSLFDVVKNVTEVRAGLTAHTVGYGFDHNSELLVKIGEWTGGTYSVVKNLEDVATVFGGILGGMVSTVAQNVRIVLPAGYKVLSQLPMETADSGETTVRIGDVQSEVSTILLLEVPVDNVAPVKVTGFDLLETKEVEQQLTIDAVPTLSEADQQNLDFAFLRVEIVGLLKEVATAPVPHPNAAPLLSRLDALEARLRAMPTTLRALTSVMEYDLKKMRDILQGRSNNLRADTGLITQHANVYATGRGMTSLAPDMDGATLAAASSHNTPFTARHTSHYAGLMATASRTANPRDEDDNPTNIAATLPVRPPGTPAPIHRLSGGGGARLGRANAMLNAVATTGGLTATTGAHDDSLDAV